MLKRCLNEKTPAYPNYGGRGIKVCERWMIFSNFLADVGERPEGLSIERIDNSKGYCPGNVKWATQREQMGNIRRNRVFTVRGITAHASELSRRIGLVPYWVTLHRINKLGWSPERAFTVPHKGHN